MRTLSILSRPYRLIRVFPGYTGLEGFVMYVKQLISLRKHAYSNILKILPPKNENFQIKNSDIFHISAHKHTLWQF